MISLNISVYANHSTHVSGIFVDGDYEQIQTRSGVVGFLAPETGRHNGRPLKKLLFLKSHNHLLSFLLLALTI